MNCCAGWKILGSDVSLGHFSFVLAATNLDAGRLFWIFSLLEPDSHLGRLLLTDAFRNSCRVAQEKKVERGDTKRQMFFFSPASASLRRR